MNGSSTKAPGKQSGRFRPRLSFVAAARAEEAAPSDRKLRIAMLGHKRVPSREGGVEIVVGELAVRMAAKGHRVDVYNRWDLFTQGGKVGDKEYRGVHIYQVPTLHNGKFNAFIYSVLATLRIMFKRYDVYHYHAIGSCAMIWLPRLLHKRTVATVHGLDWQRAKWSKFASIYLKFGEKMLAKYADEVIVLSRGNQQYLLDTYGRQSLLIPNGMEPKQAPQPDIIMAKYGLGVGDYVLYLGRLVPEKGIHYLIEAFKGIKTPMRLVIAGGIDFEDAYFKRISDMSKDDERIQFAGFVQGRELEELFGNCSVYVLPSDIEGMPLSLLEAISYGARCLVSDIEENVDAAKGCARVFKHGDVASLREELMRLIDNPSLTTTEEGAAWETWDDVTDQTLAVYRKAIDAHARRQGKPPAKEDILA